MVHRFFTIHSICCLVCSATRSRQTLNVRLWIKFDVLIKKSRQIQPTVCKYFCTRTQMQFSGQFIFQCVWSCVCTCMLTRTTFNDNGGTLFFSFYKRLVENIRTYIVCIVCQSVRNVKKCENHKKIAGIKYSKNNTNQM